MKIREEFVCPIEIVTDMLKGKWKTIILWLLRKGPIRFSKLYQSINNVSEKVLLEQLSELIFVGLIRKKVHDGYPLRVEYYLSDTGTQLLKALEIMQNIGIELLQDGCLQKK